MRYRCADSSGMSYLSSTRMSPKTPSPLFYNKEEANVSCPRLHGALQQRWQQSGGSIHCLSCHGGHARPEAKHITTTPRAHPKQRC